MKTIAIIPARGGSKRIPKKNIRLFCGKPMIAYSIEAALRSNLFDQVIVSTDSQDIAEVAIKYGAEVPFIRPKELSDDFAGTDEVVLHALHWMLIKEEINYVCCLYPTAPFLQESYLTEGLRVLQEKLATRAFSVTSFPFTIFRSLRINEAGKCEMFWSENHETRSQDLPEAYHDAGQFYWATVPSFIEEPKFFTNDTMPIVLPRYLVQDVDTIEDFETAEFLYKAMQIRNKENDER